MTWQIPTDKNGLSTIGRFSSTPARRPSSWPSSSSSGPIWSCAKPEESQSSNKDSTIGPWTSLFCSKQLWPSFFPTLPAWTNTYTCTHLSWPGGFWPFPSPLSFFYMTREENLSSGRILVGLGGKKKPTIETHFDRKHSNKYTSEKNWAKKISFNAKNKLISENRGVFLNIFIRTWIKEPHKISLWSMNTTL